MERYLRVCKDYEIKYSGKCHDLYLKSDTLLLADVFKNSRKMCLNIYQLDPVNVFSSWISMTSSFKKGLKKVKLELLTNIDMLWMGKKSIREGIYHSIYQYTKANNKYIKDSDKNNESSYLKYWDVNNLYSWAMLRKLPVSKFKCVEDTLQFNDDFIKNR